LPSAFDVLQSKVWLAPAPMAAVKLYEPGLKRVIRARAYSTRYLDTLFPLSLITQFFTRGNPVRHAY